MKRDIKSMTEDEISTIITDMGEKAYRARQVFSWLGKGVQSFGEMTNLSMDLRDKLEDSFYINVPEAVKKQVSESDGTIKYLWRLSDGNTVESVFMRYSYGNTVCISSQVGCRMGCTFCASTIDGLVRNLEPSEMLDQVRYTEKESGLKISNIVIMGIGEPLDNFDNVMRFLELVNNPDIMGIGMRHITLSTCGLPEIIDKLGHYTLQLNLSVSLHAPDDKTRNIIMPVNRSVGIDNLMRTCKDYYNKTGRRITFEYIMIDGVNDTAGHARLLAERVMYLGAHVNLIPLNKVEGKELRPSRTDNIKKFAEILAGHGVNMTVRRKLGADIDASCGQLRRKTEDML